MRSAALWLVTMASAAAILAAGQPLLAQESSCDHTVIIKVVAVSRLGLNDNGPVALNLRVPTNEGAVPVGETDASKRLFYTVCSEAAQRKKIRVRLDGSLPSGIGLQIEAVPQGAGFGSSVGAVIMLDNSEQDLVAAIRSCATGRSPTDGVALRYTVVAADPSLLSLDSEGAVRIIYTITDE